MRPDDITVQEGQLHLHTDGVFVDGVRPYPRAEKGRIQIDKSFAETLKDGGHIIRCRDTTPALRAGASVYRDPTMLFILLLNHIRDIRLPGIIVMFA